MSGVGLNSSREEIVNSQAWVGFVPMKAAMQALENTERNFVISGGIHDNHYILTCRSASKGAVCYHIRYDSVYAGWKNGGFPVYSSLQALIDDHLEQDTLVVSA